MSQDFIVVNRAVYQIVDRYGVKHFRGNLPKCDCPYTGCTKVRFPTYEVAKLYSKYRFMKYDEQLNVYWAEGCGCYHLTTAKGEVWQWV